MEVSEIVSKERFSSFSTLHASFERTFGINLLASNVVANRIGKTHTGKNPGAQRFQKISRGLVKADVWSISHPDQFYSQLHFPTLFIQFFTFSILCLSVLIDNCSQRILAQKQTSLF